LVLGHISATRGAVTVAVYAKYAFDREKREVLERCADHLDVVVTRAKARGKLRTE
jgi:hypothetical protein